VKSQGIISMEIVHASTAKPRENIFMHQGEAKEIFPRIR
jgi:hypothetical protein